MSSECRRSDQKGTVILMQEESVLERVSGAPTCRAQVTGVYSKSIWTQQLEGHWIWT